MRPTAIALIGFSFLTLIFVGLAYIRLAVLLLALLLFLLIAAGFRWRSHNQRFFWIPANRGLESQSPSNFNSKSLQIEGRKFSISDLPPRLEFIVLPRNIYAPFAIGFIAMGTLAVVLFDFEVLLKPMDNDGVQYEVFYFLCYLLGVLLLPALAWFSECALMQAPGVSLANVRRPSPAQPRTFRIAYEFKDPMGGYHGGSAMDFGGARNDELKVVFCSPINPDFNKLSCGLLFHKVRWAG